MTSIIVYLLLPATAMVVSYLATMAIARRHAAVAKRMANAAIEAAEEETARERKARVAAERIIADLRAAVVAQDINALHRVLDRVSPPATRPQPVRRREPLRVPMPVKVPPWST